MPARIPPIQCLLTFEALSRLRSVTQTAAELFVTPSAVSHRIKQLESLLGLRLFARSDYSLTLEGGEYLAHVREALSMLERVPGTRDPQARRRLRVAVTPTFARSILMPRLREFSSAHPEIDLSLHVNIPLLDVMVEETDLTIRYGSGRYADMESLCLLKDVITPVVSPDFLREHGPFASVQDLGRVCLLHSALEPWRTWFAAHDLDWAEPMDGSSFNDMGLACDAAAQGLGVALVRLQLARPWLQSGQLVRLFDRALPSPHAHYLCSRSGTMERWECTVFVQWLQDILRKFCADDAAPPGISGV